MANELEPRNHIVDDAWDDTNQILESVKQKAKDEGREPFEAYDHIDNATDLINYVEDELATDQSLQNRIQEYFMNDRCPGCEEYNQEIAMNGDIDDQRVDPTLVTHAWVDSEESKRRDADQRHTAYFVAKCGNMHDDTFITYDETWHE